MKSLMLIPSNNNYKTILNVIEIIENKKIDLDILVVEYSNNDEACEILENNNIQYLRFSTCATYGEAVSLGFKYAKSNEYDFLIQWRPDDIYQIDDFVKILDEAKENKDIDFVLGSRYINKKKKWFAKHIYRAIKLKTRKNVTDACHDVRVFNAESISEIANMKYLYIGPDIISHLIYSGYLFKEIEILPRKEKFKNFQNNGLMFLIKSIIFIILLNPIKKRGKNV